MPSVWTINQWHVVCLLLIILCLGQECMALNLMGMRYKRSLNTWPRFAPFHAGSVSTSLQSTTTDIRSANPVPTSHSGDGTQGSRHFKPKRQKIKYKADYYRRTTDTASDNGFSGQDGSPDPTTQLQDQPSNVYLNLDYNYLSTNSLFTIKHPWKYPKLGSPFSSRDKGSTGSSSLQEENPDIADHLLHSWWMSAKKWGLLTGKLAELDERQMRGNDQLLPPACTATIAVPPSSYTTETASAVDSVAAVQAPAPVTPTKPISPPPSPSAEKSPWPFLKMNKALTMRIEHLQSELGIDTATLQREVELLAQCNPSEEAIHQFGVKLLKIQAEKDDFRGRKRSTTGGKGFARNGEAKSVGEKAWQRKGQQAAQHSEGNVNTFGTAGTPPEIVPAGSTPALTPNVATPVESSRTDTSEGLATSASSSTPPLKLLHALCRTHQARVICIGDVHGCVEEVCDLLRKAEFLPGDQVVFLGDLVVKGPSSVEVVQLAMDIGALSVRGNHDHAVVKERTLYMQALQEMQAQIASSVAGEPQLGVQHDSNAAHDASSEQNAVGRKYAKFVEDTAHTSATSKMPQHLRVAAALTEEQASWLSDLPYFIRSLDLGAVFVHAGLLNNVRLPYQEPWIMMTMRSQMPSGRASSRCLTAHPWAKTWKGPLTAYFGHDTARGLQVYPSAYGIDTGCVYGGNLTAVLLPDQTIVSVPARQAYLKFK